MMSSGENEENRVNLLFADDEPACQMAYEMALRKSGHQLVIVGSGEEALARTREMEFAAIVLDINLGGMDGFQTAALIRAQEHAQYTSIIFASGLKTSDIDISYGYEIGAIDYLIKPVNVLILRSKIAFFVDLYRKKKALERQTGELARANASLLEEISRRRNAEQALRHAHADLENHVRERTAELVRATTSLQQEIQERMKAQEQLLDDQKQLRSMASQLTLAEERERRQIASLLHDDVIQTLALIKIRMGALKGQLPPTPELLANVDQLRELIEQTIQNLRTLTFQLSPPILYELGLEAALGWLADQITEQHKIRCQFTDDGQPKPLEDDTRVLLFTAARELLLNVVKHAQAASATVSVSRAGDQIKVEVQDDGVGFESAGTRFRPRKSGGFGLFNIRERMDHFGGRFEIHSRPGSGARMLLIAPLKSPKAIS